MTNKNEWLGLSKRNLTVANAIESIRNLERESGLAQSENSFKWKNYSHQVVIGTDNYFYKVYEDSANNAGPFNSAVRNALAAVYDQLGIYWKILTFTRDGKIFNFEQREILDVCDGSTLPFEEILLSFSKLLDKVQVQLEFESILKQLKPHKAFAKVEKLQLARQCVNKFNDYALYKGQAVLLDDAEWYIALLDASGKRVIVSPEYEVPIKTTYGNFLFSAYTIVKKIDGQEKNLVNCNDAFIHGWYLISNKKATAGENQSISTSGQIQAVKPRPDTYNVVNATTAQIAKSLQVSEKKAAGEYKFFPIVNRKTLENYETLFSNKCTLYGVGYFKSAFQWKLWDACNSSCAFCNAERKPNVLNEEALLSSLSGLLGQLNNFDANKYNNVTLLGCELFQGWLESKQVAELYYEVIEKLARLYESKRIGSIWLCASLTQGTQKHLYKTLELFRQAGVKPSPNYETSGIWLFTKWGGQELFSAEEELKNWEFHMHNVLAYYPWVKRNTTITLTQAFCENYLAGNFSPHHFMGKYQTSICYTHPTLCCDGPNMAVEVANEFYSWLSGKLDTKKQDSTFAKIKKDIENKINFSYLPTHNTFRKFLMKYARVDADTFDSLLDAKFIAPEMQMVYNSQALAPEGGCLKNVVSNCCCAFNVENPHCTVNSEEKKHNLSFALYLDSSECMLCEKYKIWKGVWQ